MPDDFETAKRLRNRTLLVGGVAISFGLLALVLIAALIVLVLVLVAEQIPG